MSLFLYIAYVNNLLHRRQDVIEEKGTWVYLMVNVGTYAAYLITVLGRAANTPLTEVSYVSTMLWTIGIAIALSIVGIIAVAVSKPSEADKRDERDKDINRFGEYVGGIVLAVGMLVPFGLAMAEIEHFWVANAIYAAFVLSSLVTTIVKLVAYRRGF